MAQKRKHKLLVSNLSDQLSSGVDGTGILTGCRSSSSTRRTNQTAAGGAVAASEDANVAMAEGGILDIVDEVGEEFGNITAENDRENYNGTIDDYRNYEDDYEDKEEEEDGSSDNTPCARGGRPRNNRTHNSDINDKYNDDDDDEDDGDEELKYDDDVEKEEDDDYEPITPRKNKNNNNNNKIEIQTNKENTTSKSKVDYVIDDTRVKRQETWKTSDKLTQ